MKFIGFFFALVAVASAQIQMLPDGERQFVENVFKNFVWPCQTVADATDADIINLMNYDAIAEHNRATKCTLNCLLKQFSFLSEKDGVYGFHPDLFEQLNTLGHIPDEAMTPINELAVACRIESPDECEIADLTVKCFVEEIAKLIAVK